MNVFFSAIEAYKTTNFIVLEIKFSIPAITNNSLVVRKSESARIVNYLNFLFAAIHPLEICATLLLHS